MDGAAASVASAASAASANAPALQFSAGNEAITGVGGKWSSRSTRVSRCVDTAPNGAITSCRPFNWILSDERWRGFRILCMLGVVAPRLLVFLEIFLSTASGAWIFDRGKRSITLFFRGKGKARTRFM